MRVNPRLAYWLAECIRLCDETTPAESQALQDAEIVRRDGPEQGEFLLANYGRQA